MTTTTLEEILRHHGDPGRAQMIICVLLLFSLFHAGMIQQINVLFSHTPDHHCTPPPDSNWTELELNKSDIFPDKCSMYKDPTNHSLGKTACIHGYTYITLNEEIFPSNEFDLVCDDFYWVENNLAITFFGVFIGGVIFGPISDRFGRKRSLSYLLLALSILSVSLYVVGSFAAFVSLRFLLGIFNQGVLTVGLTYNSELFQSRMRTLTGAAVGFMWALMLPSHALMFYTLGHWRYVHLIMGSLTCISAAYIWFLPESVPWLLSRWKIDEAVTVLNCFARVNKIEPYANLQQELQDVAQNVRNRNENASKQNLKWYQLFTTPIVRRIMFYLMYIWFASQCVVFGVSFSISALKGNNMYINYVISGCIELAVRLSIMALFVKYGRITIMSPVLLSCGVLTIIGFMIWHYVPDSYRTVQTVAAVIVLIGRNLMSVNISMIIIFTSELTPTALRSSGVGFGFASARLGNVLSPFIGFLKKWWIPLPQMTFGIMAIAAGFLMLTLPETLNAPLPSTLQDVQELTTLKKKKKNQKDEVELNDLHVIKRHGYSTENENEKHQLESLIGKISQNGDDNQTKL